MRFPYSTSVVGQDENGDAHVLSRPEIRVRVIGLRRSRLLWALVDTGADYTVLPTSVATYCGIETFALSQPQLLTFTGDLIEARAGEVTLELEQGGTVVRWRAEVLFHEFGNASHETMVLGHSGFLDYFTATFDGLDAILTLVPNLELPVAS